jgi:hypothetical protein
VLSADELPDRQGPRTSLRSQPSAAAVYFSCGISS